MSYRQRHYLYIALGVAAIAAGLTFRPEPRASADGGTPSAGPAPQRVVTAPNRDGSPAGDAIPRR